MPSIELGTTTKLQKTVLFCGGGGADRPRDALAILLRSDLL
ncbi:MAG: hypothetical protein WA220_08865 [Candidatus Nitrosopolaris sp.]